MSDIIALIKEQSEKRIAEVRTLSGKLSEQLKHLISLIPEGTRQKSVEALLNDIRKSVLGEAKRQAPKKARSSSRGRVKKAGAAPGKRGRKKKAVSPAAETGQGGL
ncbi:MAG: hypothetical protein M0Z58_07910 [Nitrospiraceae bacterium]|nr:hypothetical protein [Nitrospiraceae bacterium]